MATRSQRNQTGRYTNQPPTEMGFGLKTSLTLLRDALRPSPNRRPAQPLPVLPLQPGTDNQPRLTWWGHSALLLELAGKRILLDPMFGPSPSPVPLFGAKRYSHPIQTGALPQIDAVILSHDHYDHLDHGTIRQLKDRVGRFIVPLGVERHLIRWGVDPAKITAHDWWEEIEWEDLRLVCTPAQHFSGRGLTDRNQTLWCSWVIQSETSKIFFSGDSGYAPHFQAIGEAFGPFDLTLMECGQYDDRWPEVHMRPEETVQAHLDLKGALLIPIHWGAFTLAFHDWTDPIERVVRAAQERQVRIATPQIGESLSLGAEATSSTWWRMA